jgi:LacI family transcriptional regulator
MRRIAIQLDFAGGYGRGVLRGVMRYANLRADWEFVMPPMYSLASKKLEDPQPADGVIAMLHAARSFEPFRRAGIPIINTARTLTATELRQIRVPTVLPDDAAVGRLAHAYVRERGFRAFGFCGHPTASWSRVRRESFAAACRGDPGTTFFSAFAAADRVSQQWVRSLPRPCAILAGNDRYAWHAIDACRESHVAVPEEIAVLGVDNDVLLTEMARPTLSSIELGGERIGFEAARMLDRLLQRKRVNPDPVELPPDGVITRHSTDVLSIDDESVAAAASFIRERASAPIGVADVTAHVAMSRRNLERRFRRVLRRSLLDEIRRVHLERAQQLLRDTDLDMPDVAEQSGFASQVRFSTVFKEMTGETPTGYRRRHRPGLS